MCACALRNNGIMASFMRGQYFLRAGDEKLTFNKIMALLLVSVPEVWAGTGEIIYDSCASPFP